MIEPPPQMAMYRFVSANASAGAFMTSASTPESSGTSTVITAPMRKNAAMLVPMILPPESRSPSPIFCPSKMVVPIANELMRFVTVIMICEPTATPETSAAVAYFPTTSRSTAP